MANGGTLHWPAPVKVHFTAPKAGSTTPVIFWPEPLTISGWFECPPSCTFRAEEQLRLTLTVASRGGVPTSSNAAADPEMKWLPFYRPTSSNTQGNSPKIAQMELLNQAHPKSLKGEKIEFKMSGLQIHDWARNRVWGLNVVLERQACEAQGWRVLPIEGHTTMTLHIKSMNWQERYINAEKQVDELKKERQNLRNRNTRLEKRMAEAKQNMAELKKGKGDGGATAKRKREGAVVIDSDDEPILKKPKQI